MDAVKILRDMKKDEERTKELEATIMENVETYWHNNIEITEQQQ